MTTELLETNIPGVSDILSAFRPRADRLTVIKDAVSEGVIELQQNDGKKIKVTRSGFQIPDTAKLPIITGTVIQVGANLAGRVDPGTRIVFANRAGTDLTINGKTFTVMGFQDLVFAPGPPIHVFNDRVMIVPDDLPKMIGLIHVPDTATDQPQCGKVIASGVKSLREGDRVLFGKFAGSILHWQDRDVLVIRDSDIFAYLDDNEK